MPIYEYMCPDCRKTFEVMRSVSQSSDAAPCPTCHQSGRRVLSLFASFSKGADGATTAVAGTGGCSACSSHSCSTCGIQ
ncbi:MAG: zinc ribbon domain-containing protein [Chloroflexi bacterium]|nr:zinc ribbon domain-containing protein [Chloroflexota bacterium]